MPKILLPLVLFCGCFIKPNPEKKQEGLSLPHSTLAKVQSLDSLVCDFISKTKCRCVLPNFYRSFMSFSKDADCPFMNDSDTANQMSYQQRKISMGVTQKSDSSFSLVIGYSSYLTTVEGSGVDCEYPIFRIKDVFVAKGRPVKNEWIE